MNHRALYLYRECDDRHQPALHPVVRRIGT